MDEVDGVSANDRGGLGALILIIKKTLVPIICISNDRHHRKLVSLMNHCYDLKFQKPSIQDIMKRVKIVAENEYIKVDPKACEKMIELSQFDIRSVLNMLQMHCTTSKSVSTYEINRKQYSV